MFFEIGFASDLKFWTLKCLHCKRNEDWSHDVLLEQKTERKIDLQIEDLIQSSN